MAERTFSVSVTTSKPKNIVVKSAVSQNEITAKGDTSLYYSELAKKWAISDEMVMGEDYSAKMYAQTAKDYAEQGKGYLDSAVIVYNDFDNQSSLTLREIATVRSESLEEFNVALNEGKDVAVGAIEEEKTSAINAIENEKDIAIQKIDDAFAELGGDLSDVKIVADNIETVQTIGQNVENILNKTVDVGTTVTGEAGTSAKVENVGTQFAPVLNFTIPRGNNGVDGGMDATYDEETQTLSFYSEKGNAFHPKWGTITGDIASQEDLKTALEEVASSSVDLTDYVKNTDYANATASGSAGIVKCSSTFACGCVNGYIQAMNIPTLERYNNLSQYAFIGKATLQTALTEYSKTVLTTQADYDALATKDANTLYLIEE